MSSLRIFNQTDPQRCILQTTDRNTIQEHLAKIHIRFEQWPLYSTLDNNPTVEQISKTYETEINSLIAVEGYQSWDVISLTPENPSKEDLRKKFLSEHSHGEDEVRYFVSGQGLFTLHIDKLIYCILCEKGDFISVPAGILHWFDMGANPDFTAIRFFNNPDGWVATYSGDDIAQMFPRLE